MVDHNKTHDQQLRCYIESCNYNTKRHLKKYSEEDAWKTNKIERFETRGPFFEQLLTLMAFSLSPRGRPIFEQFVLKISVILLLLCVTIATNLSTFLLTSYA